MWRKYVSTPSNNIDVWRNSRSAENMTIARKTIRKARINPPMGRANKIAPKKRPLKSS